MPKLVYHVLPDQGKWIVRKGSAKKASVVKESKKEAMAAARDLAKSSPNSQVIVHKSSGIIETHWLYTRSDYEEKTKKKLTVKKARKTKAKNKRKAQDERRKRRKAALLGIARKKSAGEKKVSAPTVKAQVKPVEKKSLFARLFKLRG
jgi:Uncharacterized protein conserved in bacteria (DUF2188)